MSRRSCRAVAFAGATAVTAAVAGPLPAEFAMRWDPRQGGPANLDEVVAALGMKDAKSRTFEVRYLGIAPTATLPAGYAVIGRERTESGRTEATYKLRGPAPLPRTLAGWRCPLAGTADSKVEVDVTLTGAAGMKRSLSLSCSVDGKTLAEVLPAGWAATALGCSSSMTRRKKGDLSVERWSLPAGRVVFEVSMKGSDTPADLARFRATVAARLAAKHAVPLDESKTELGSRC